MVQKLSGIFMEIKLIFYDTNKARFLFATSYLFKAGFFKRKDTFNLASIVEEFKICV